MNSTLNQNIGPTLDEINRAARMLAGRIVKTPCVELTSSRIAPLLPNDCQAVMKLELFQNAGSFKATLIPITDAEIGGINSIV